VLSSILAACTDVSNTTDISQSIPPASAAMGVGLELMSDIIYRLNVGYVWMFANCLTSAAYVRPPIMTIYTSLSLRLVVFDRFF
jgi:GDP-mannose transporter